MTTDQVAQFLHVKTPTVIKFVKDGVLTAHRLPGTRRLLFWRQDIIDLVDASVVTPGDMVEDADRSVTTGE